MQLYKDNLGKVALTVSESYWDINKDYDKLLIIEVEGQYQTYVSRKPVPAGTQITDRRYWIPFSSLKEEIKLNYSKWFNTYGSLIDSNANTLNNLQLQLNELTKNLPGLHLSGNISEFEIGVPTNIILTFGTNDGKKAKFNLYGNNVLIQSFYDSEVTFNTTTDETVEFKVECIQYGVTYESTWNVAAIAPYYIGAGETYEDVLGVSDWKRGAKSDISGLYSINVEDSNKKFFVCIPSFIVVDSVKMNGFDVPMKNLVDATYNGITYKVLESENFYVIGEHNIQINQYQGDESDLLYSLIATVNTFDDRINEAEENAQQAKDKILNTNDEDITTDNDKNLIFADKQYDAADYSGLGRVYLRKNMIVVSLPFNGFLQTSPPIDQSILADVPDVIFFDVPGERFVCKKGYRYYINWQNNEGYRANLTNGDLFSYDNKYYEYNDGTLAVKENPSKTNVLTQAMLNKTNTIYHIQYDYDLNGVDITVPEGCVLEFNGGSLRNGTLVGSNTGIKAKLVKIFATDIILEGSWNVTEAYPEWFGAKGINGIDDSNALYCALNMPCNYVCFSKLYYISKPVLLKSYVHIVGNYGMHTYKFGIIVNQDFTSVVHNTQTIKSIFYLNSNASAPLIFEDAYFCGNYKANTLIHFQKDAPRFNVRLYRCNLFKFYQAAIFAAGNDACVINECLIQFCGVGVVGSDEQINFSDPLHYSGITGLGRSNHLIIHKCVFYACNVGVIIKRCSDCSLNDNLFSHASLCTMLLSECKAGVLGNYIENDWNCGFWITENGSDPVIDKESPSYYNPILAEKDVDIRAYIMLNNVQLELDSAFFSNYYVRCNSTVGGNAFNNKNVSGIDSLIYITNQCNIHIGNKRIRIHYNDGTSAYIYDVISKDVQDVELSEISSTEIIKYRNLIEDRSGKTYAPCLHFPILSSIEKKNKSIVFGENVLLQRPDGQPANFLGSYTLSEIIGNDYFYKRSNALVTRNSLFISANDLGDIQYRAELKFHGNVAVDRISISAVYSSGDPVTRNYAVEGYSNILRTLYLYFSKADFIESDRELLGIYVYDNGYITSDSTGVVSSIMVFEEGCDEPVYISLPTHGTTRPLISDNIYYEFFDENSNVNKKIFHIGTVWVDSKGQTPAPHQGTTTQREALVLNASTDIGFDFYDTTLGVKLYAGAIDSNGAVTRWLDEEGYTYHLKSGYERPTNLTIFDNYMPFYDLNLEMMIYAHISGSGSGTTIVWKDADGHTPLPKTATLNDSSAATYLGTTHADATSDDIGMEVWITDKNKVAYLGDVVTAGSIVQHKWYYADGTVALDESQAPTPSV